MYIENVRFVLPKQCTWNHNFLWHLNMGALLIVFDRVHVEELRLPVRVVLYVFPLTFTDTVCSLGDVLITALSFKWWMRVTWSILELWHKRCYCSDQCPEPVSSDTEPSHCVQKKGVKYENPWHHRRKSLVKPNRPSCRNGEPNINAKVGYLVSWQGGICH